MLQSNPKLPLSKIVELFGVSIQAIHKQLKNKGIVPQKLGNKGFLTHSTARQFFNLAFKKKKITFQIVKGGTGKTTAVQNISCCASLYGAKILLIDIDPQGNLTDAFGLDTENLPVLIDVINNEASIESAIHNVEEGIDLIPSRIENVTLDSKLAISKAPLHNMFSNILESIEDKYDFIFIDCPPMMGHSVTAASLYADLILVPLNPDKFSAKGLQIVQAELSNLNREYKANIEYKVFLNKFSGNTILSDKAIQTTISTAASSGHALTTAIRLSQEIPNSIDENLNMFSALKKSTARDDFDLITRELLDLNFENLNIS